MFKSNLFLIVYLKIFFKNQKKKIFQGKHNKQKQTENFIFSWI